MIQDLWAIIKILKEKILHFKEQKIYSNNFLNKGNLHNSSGFGPGLNMFMDNDNDDFFGEEFGNMRGFG